MTVTLRSIFLLGALSACSATPPARTAAGNGQEPQSASAPARPAAEGGPTALAIAQDIRDACGISEPTAFFAYNSSQVSSRDRAVLAQLAACFTTGPLKGRGMRLVGHADPRGDDEYNYLLGQRRADQAKEAIVKAGMLGASISTTSRGENEAAGTDEPSWAKDRRVEVQLGGAI